MEITPQAVVYQAVLFVVLYFILKSLVFDRFLANLDARHHRTRGAIEESAKLREQAARLTADYETQLAKIRHEAAVAREEIRRQAEQGEREVLETARGEAAKTLADARRRIAEEAGAARSALESQTGDLSRQIVARLLKRA